MIPPPRPKVLTRHRPTTRPARAAVLAAIVACCVGLFGCGNGDAGDDEAAWEDRSVDIYSGIISRLGAEIERDPEEDGTPTVFVEGLDGATIPIEVQVGVVGALEEELTVRFIDERSEAFDEAIEEAPVRDDGRFVELGTIPDGADVQVAVRAYRSASDAEERSYRASESSDGWDVEESTPAAASASDD
jgi:hypothetical protein